MRTVSEPSELWLVQTERRVRKGGGAPRPRVFYISLLSNEALASIPGEEITTRAEGNLLSS